MLSKFFTNLLVFAVAINCVVYLFGAFNVDPLVRNPMNLSSFQSWFDLSPFNIMLTGATAAVIGLAAVLLRQGTYAIYAMLLWALGMIITPIRNFILAFLLLIGGWLRDSTNPFPAVNGVYPPNPIVIVISLLFAFAAYWFIFGLVIQRDIS